MPLGSIPGTAKKKKRTSSVIRLISSGNVMYSDGDDRCVNLIVIIITQCISNVMFYTLNCLRQTSSYLTVKL